MSNQAYLDILNQGVKFWNEWRDQNPGFRQDLRAANLRGLHLQNANLSMTDLREADFTDSDLHRADLSSADLRGAKFHHANLTGTNLSRSKLARTSFKNAICLGTIFGDVDLREPADLGLIVHRGYSLIGVQTIYRSHGEIPDKFLRGAGVPESLIVFMKSLKEMRQGVYSCFISYSSEDELFVKRLDKDLRASGITCYFAPRDLPIGNDIRSEIDEAIRSHDRLLVVLSQNSIGSPWVQKEVETAFEIERQEKRTVLFPIRIDEDVLNTSIAWAADIRRSRNIGNFCHWTIDACYNEALEKLLRDLRAETNAESASQKC